MVALCCPASALLTCWAQVWLGISQLYRWGNTSIWGPCFSSFFLSITLSPCPLWDGPNLTLWAVPSQPH